MNLKLIYKQMLSIYNNLGAKMTETSKSWILVFKTLMAEFVNCPLQALGGNGHYINKQTN